MKHIGIIVCVIFFLGCSQNRIALPFPEDRTISDEYGVPEDSMSAFFPEVLFNDTTTYSLKWLKLKLRSYMLYKMKEPVLSNFYSKKEIYRLIIMGSFSKPMTVRIEKSADSIIIYSKVLNRNIRYPFMVYDTSTIISYNGKTIHQTKAERDSLFNLYNSTNYVLFLERKSELSNREWESLCVLIDSTKFWKTNPDVALHYLQIDGSNWIFEGHNKFGYQIRDIPNPNFDRTYVYENEFDKSNNYRNLFEYIVKISDLNMEHYY